MATSGLSDVVQHFVGAAIQNEEACPSDGRLLIEYLESRDNALLAILVRRHSSMVWNVCRRVLRTHHDAEDAFQATFLVLVRKAGSISPPELLGNWLYGVAYQTALKARATTAKRHARESQGMAIPEPGTIKQDPWDEVLPLLDQVLRKLPDKYRAAIVLCDLEEKTRKEVAQQLGVPEGTVAARLARARALLAKRIARYGVKLNSSTLAALMAAHAVSAAPSSALVSSTIHATVQVASSRHIVSQASVQSILASRVLRAMMFTKYQSRITAMLLLIVLGVGFSAAFPYALTQQDSMKQAGMAWPLVVNQPVRYWRSRHVLRGHEDNIQCLAFGPNNVLISGDNLGYIKVWDTDAGKDLGTLPNSDRGVAGIVYATDASWVAFRYHLNIALSFDKGMKDGKPLHIGARYGSGNLVPLALAPDGKTYAWRILDSHFTQNYSVQVFDQDLTKRGLDKKKTDSICTGHTDVPLCAAFSSAATDLSDVILATGSADKTVRLWDALTGKTKFILKGHAQAVKVVEFSPDGKTLATGSNDGTLKLWDVTTGKVLVTLKGEEAVNCLSFAPYGKSLASAGDDMLVKLWNVATGQQLGTLKGHTDSINAIRFNRDGSMLASTGADKTVRLWQY
ncbi:MAG: sigma-70 family RNA polymerase sigma factor [Gemmatales bacterium]